VYRAHSVWFEDPSSRHQTAISLMDICTERTLGDIEDMK
jgi:hypothetical protein